MGCVELQSRGVVAQKAVRGNLIGKYVEILDLQRLQVSALDVRCGFDFFKGYSRLLT